MHYQGYFRVANLTLEKETRNVLISSLDIAASSINFTAEVKQ